MRTKVISTTRGGSNGGGGLGNFWDFLGDAKSGIAGSEAHTLETKFEPLMDPNERG